MKKKICVNRGDDPTCWIGSEKGPALLQQLLLNGLFEPAIRSYQTIEKNRPKIRIAIRRRPFVTRH